MACSGPGRLPRDPPPPVWGDEVVFIPSPAYMVNFISSPGWPLSAPRQAQRGPFCLKLPSLPSSHGRGLNLSVNITSLRVLLRAPTLFWGLLPNMPLFNRQQELRLAMMTMGNVPDTGLEEPRNSGTREAVCRSACSFILHCPFVQGLLCVGLHGSWSHNQSNWEPYLPLRESWRSGRRTHRR